MKTVTIYGASDDLIELRGDIEEEFGTYEVGYLHFDDGTILKVSYCEVEGKCWDVTAINLSSSALLERLEPELEDGEHFSDRVRLVGNFESVDCFDNPDGPTDDDLELLLDNLNTGRLDKSEIRSLYYAVKKLVK